MNAPTIPDKGLRKRIIGMRRLLQAENKLWPSHLVEVPRHEWPADAEGSAQRIAVWRSSRLLVQEFAEPSGIIRLSVNRTNLNGQGDWDDGLSWDELQAVKDAVGFAEDDAVEVFPAHADIVDVANMRHLWVLPYALPFAWRTPK
jgi:hypothetical protein